MQISTVLAVWAQIYYPCDKLAGIKCQGELVLMVDLIPLCLIMDDRILLDGYYTIERIGVVKRFPRAFDHVITVECPGEKYSFGINDGNCRSLM